MISLKILGSPQLVVNGVSIRPFRKSLALLSFLGMESSRTHERSFLSDLLWPALPKERADHSLAQSLYSLRKILEDASSGPCFMTDRTTVRFNPEFIHILDATLLSIPPAGCTILHDPEKCSRCEEQISMAFAEIRGPFLEGFSLPECEDFENWVTGVREELLLRSRWGMEGLLRLHERNDHLSEALSVVSRYLKMDALDEASHRRLMVLFARGGNRQASELQYESCRKTLRDILGVEPGEETRRLLTKIRSETSSPGTADPLPSGLRPPFFVDRHPATVLFLELLAGTEGDPDQPLLQIGDLMKLALKKAREMGGLTVRTHGNTFLSFFGLQDCPEGAARKAARAASEIPCLLSREWNRKDEPLNFRGGIHSGLIVRGGPSDPPDHTGAVSRTAMSLGMQAEQGTVLVSETAAPLLKGQFLLENAGDFRIPGDRRKAFILRGFPEGLAENAPSVPKSQPLFGRHREIARFSGILDKNQGGILILEGEAGIGKTALAHAFLAHARSRGALVRTLECCPQYTDSPFFPLVRLLRVPAAVPVGMDRKLAYGRLSAYVQSLELPRREDAVATLGYLFSLPPHPDYPLPEQSPEALRKGASDLFLSIAGSRSAHRPFLLFVEDLHWIDASTGDLLRELISNPVLIRKIFILMTTRPGEGPPWLETIGKPTRIRLSPLGNRDARALVHRLASDAGLPKEATAGVVRAADGIPLFLEELTRSLIESSGNACPFPNSFPGIPGTLEEVLGSRLDRLSTARPLLQKAALVGRTVPIDLLKDISSRSDDDFEKDLELCVRSGLIRIIPDPSGEVLEFRHALVQDAASRSLLRQDRKDLHQKIAEAIIRRFPAQSASNPELVANHFEEAGKWEASLDWYAGAISRAISMGSYREGERFLRNALGILEKSPPFPEKRTREIRLLTHLGNILIDLHGQGNPEIERVFRKALSLARDETDLPEEIFLAFFGLWDSSFGGTDLRESRKIADTLLELSENRGKRLFRIVSLFADGATAFWEGRFVQSLSLMEHCLSISEQSPDPETSGSTVRQAAVIQAANYRPWLLWYTGRYRSALKALGPALDRARSSDNSPRKGHLLTFALVLFRYLRLPERALEVADMLHDSIRALKTEGWSPPEKGFRGWAMVALGQPGGIPLILESIPLSRKFHHMGEINYLALLSESYLTLGHAPMAMSVADSALRFSLRSGTTFFDSELYRLKGEAARLQGNRKTAREFMERALEISRTQGATALELRATTSLGKLLEQSGFPREARNLLVPFGDLLDGPESDPALPDIQEAIGLRKRLEGRKTGRQTCSGS